MLIQGVGLLQDAHSLSTHRTPGPFDATMNSIRTPHGRKNLVICRSSPVMRMNVCCRLHFRLASLYLDARQTSVLYKPKYSSKASPEFAHHVLRDLRRRNTDKSPHTNQPWVAPSSSVAPSSLALLLFTGVCATLDPHRVNLI